MGDTNSCMEAKRGEGGAEWGIQKNIALSMIREMDNAVTSGCA